MLTSTFPLSVPQMLRTILLTASLSAQNGRAGDLPCRAGCAHLAQNPGDGEAAAGLAETQQHSQWDNPICTEGVVSVSRGERAVMACNISNPFLSVAIYLSSHGKSFEPVFSMRPPGCFCQGGWRLQVQGSMAQLVIDDVNHTQAGCYRWYLQGLQRNIRVTTLNVSGAESQDLKVRGSPLFTQARKAEFPCPPPAGSAQGPRRDASELEDGGPTRRVINRPETQNRLPESCPTLRPPAPVLTPQEWSPVCPTSIWLTDAQEPRSGGRQKQAPVPACWHRRPAQPFSPRSELSAHPGGRGGRGEDGTQAGSRFSSSPPPPPPPQASGWLLPTSAFRRCLSSPTPPQQTLWSKMGKPQGRLDGSVSDSVVKHLPSAQVMIPGSWDCALLSGESACPSPSASPLAYALSLPPSLSLK
ncbi:secreted and transmembrane protein 1 isoform X2 [Zalophus californianus]|nr:secreted and transmembrane protein 1 isoform X2 [Zalophus californianus]XP_027424208.2 secreted and transmembrane protein 1 isoform X2 [Zalophus californianus]